MRDLVARAIETGSLIGSRSEVVRIDYELGSLRIVIRSSANSGATVVFEDVVGYRVLDERSLGEYWKACSAPHGRLFEILAGGWLDQESQRSTFLEGDVIASLKEFLVAGLNDCVSVLAVEQPEVRAHAL